MNTSHVIESSGRRRASRKRFWQHMIGRSHRGIGIRLKCRGVVLLTLLATLGLSACGGDSPNAEAVTSPLAGRFTDPVERGRYLARAGNCIACHTRSGEVPFSGGKAIPTPFGTVYSSNLTSDVQTGLGAWTADDFWQALHHGKSRDGRDLYPAFPYTSYTYMTRDDSDALFQYLQTLPAVSKDRPEHRIGFPYNTALAMKVWRWLYFEPSVYEIDEQQSDSWNRGAYLVQGLGHCSACHTPRGRLGNSESKFELAGAHIEGLGWDALPLTQGNLPQGDRAQLVELLQNGINERDVLSGPMAEVVFHSLQYLESSDLSDMVTYLLSLPTAEAPAAPQIRVSDSHALLMREQGQLLYQDHCLDCHGEQGEGVAYRYPALAGNRAVLSDSPNNVIQSLLGGGFGASTEGRPRPFGMPPYAHQMDATQLAAVLTYVRQSWGNGASAVSPERILQQ